MEDFIVSELDGAMDRVMKEAYEDEVSDVIRHADFRAAWPALRTDLLERLGKGEYRPRRPEIVEVPKGALATRPIAVLDLVDRVFYDAVMTRLAPAIDAELMIEIHSARLTATRKGRKAQPDQRKAWVGFQKQGREMCEKYDNACMLTTDITSYFEFINLKLLIAELRLIAGIDGSTVDLLATVLHGLSDTSDLNGIPQGPEVSSLLGNFYLRPLDAILRKLDVNFIRFQDDIKVFASDSHLLRRAVHQLTPVVRGRHLNLSSAKTKLVEGPEVIEHFEDSRKDGLQYRIDIEDATVLPDICELFDDAVADPNDIQERDVKFAVWRLKKFESDHAIPWILDHLAEVPYLSVLLVGYLSDHVRTHPEVEEHVEAFLRDDLLNISPFVELQLLRMMARLPAVSDTSYQLLWDVLMDPGRDTRSRQMAARAIGRHIPSRDTADLVLLKALFQKTSADTGLRRALVIAMREGGNADNKFLGEVSMGAGELKPVCDFLRGNPKLPPP